MHYLLRPASPARLTFFSFLSSLWNLTFSSLRSLDVEKKLQQNNFFQKYAAGQVFRGKRCRQVGSYIMFGPRTTNCFQFRLRLHQACFILWTLKPFFFLFCWMYSGRKQVQLYTSTERSVKIGYSQVNLASRWDLASSSCSYACWETKQPKWMKKVHLASAQLASSFILCCSFRSLSFATLHLRVIRRKLDLLDVWPLVQEASGVHMPPYIT